MVDKCSGKCVEIANYMLTPDTCLGHCAAGYCCDSDSGLCLRCSGESVPERETCWYQMIFNGNECTMWGQTAKEAQVSDRHVSRETDVGVDQYGCHYSHTLTSCSFSTDNCPDGYFRKTTLFENCMFGGQNVCCSREESQAEGTYEVIGSTSNAVLFIAIIGAVSVIYYATKGIHKMISRTSDFQQIGAEAEC